MPHEIELGSPSPSSASVVSDRIARETVSTVLAKSTGKTFGRMWRRDRCQLPGPERSCRAPRTVRSFTRERLRADEPGGARPRRHGDDDDDGEQAPAPDRREHDREGDPRDHQEPVGDGVQDGVDLAAEVARGDADDGAEDHGADRGGRDRPSARPARPRRSGPSTESSEVVGAEPVGSRRWRALAGSARSRRRGPAGPGRRAAGPNSAREMKNAQDDQPDHPLRVVPEQAPVAGRGAPAPRSTASLRGVPRGSAAAGWESDRSTVAISCLPDPRVEVAVQDVGDQVEDDRPRRSTAGRPLGASGSRAR